MAEKSLRQLYTESRSDYMGNEEKKSLAASGAPFTVHTFAYGEGTYGPTAQFGVNVNGEDRWLTLSYTPARKKWVDALAAYVKDNGPTQMTLKRIELRDGNEFFDLVPPE